MKTFIPVGLIVLLLFCGCGQSNYDTIKSDVDGIRVIDTHSHQGNPWKQKHNLFDSGLYLHADLISAGMQEYSDSMQQEHDADAYWQHTAAYLRYCRATSYYRQFIANYQKLYGLKNNEIGKSDFLQFSEQMETNFKKYESWINTVCETNNIEIMFADRLWQAFDTDFDPDHFRYVFRFDQLVLECAGAARLGRISNAQALDFLDLKALPIKDLTDYLDFIDQILDRLVQHHVVALKMGLAYHRSLDFLPVDLKKAETIFRSKNPSTYEITLLQDYIVYYIVHQAFQYDLPIQIHTGYLHGNGGILDRGHPVKLLPLIRANPKTSFVLFHGGYPWTSEFVAMGKHYPNVYLDLVWLPQISRSVAIRTLHEMLDCVPYNKIGWGSDVGNIDEAAGSLEVGREVVATVLAERCDQGLMSMELARDIGRRIFRGNAIELYNLDFK